ncbi:MAG: hypothetical protein HYU36_13095 [Planctomycetes bacterium]|nr:hypothetical protein [Planctomycetota bacterium]
MSLESELVGRYAEALKAYRSREWMRAIEGFKQCLALRAADPAARALIERCRTFQASPSPSGLGWRLAHAEQVKGWPLHGFEDAGKSQGRNRSRSRSRMQE